MRPHTDLQPTATPQAGAEVLAGQGLALVVAPGRAADPAFERHTTAVERGFYEQVPSGEAMAQLLEAGEADGRRMVDVLPLGADPATTRPVATFEDFRSELTVSPGVAVPAWLISGVTVDPGFRRRGLLRTMMTRSLADAVAAGVPVAALTASEAAIYGRFGFGAATRWRRARLDTRGDVRLRGAPSAGRVTREEPREVGALADELYQRVRRLTPGATQRPTMTAIGWEDRSRFKNDGKGSGLYAAVHRDAAGTAQGIALYRPQGWDVEPPTVTMELFLALTPDARHGLLTHLTSLDLIERIVWERAPEAGWPEALLEDERRLRTERDGDDLYLRILDVPAALGARADLGDGEVVVDVTDPLGHAAGAWRIRARDGVAEVTEAAEGEAELGLDVADLSAVWLGGHGAAGGVAARVATGLVREVVPGAGARLDALLRPSVPVRSLVGF